MLSDIERTLWHSLAMTLSLAEMPIKHKIRALHWLSEVAASTERKEKTDDIARVIEEVLLDVVEAARRHKLPTEATRRIVQTQLVPLAEGPLLQHFNPTVRQLVGIVIDRKEQLRATRTIGAQFPDGTSHELEVTEEEAIRAALAALRSAEKDPSKIKLGPTWIDPKIERRLADGKVVRIPYRVELILLLPDADVKTQRQLAEHLLQYFLVVDPSIAKELLHFQEVLTQSDDAEARRDALTGLIEAYLVSPYFSLVRDFIHGIRVLRDGPVEVVDRFSGIGRDSRTPTAGPPALRILGMLQPSSPGPSKRGLVVLAIKTRAIFEDVRRQLLAEYSPDQVSYLSAYVREGAENRISIFESLWDFCLGLMLAESPADFGLPPEQSTLLRNWVTGFLTKQLGVRTDASTPELQAEYIRRHVHAVALRLGVYIAASPSHVRELQSKSQNGDVVMEWLVRGLVLADRLLVIAYHDQVFRFDEGPSDSRPSMEDLKRGLDRTFTTLGVGIDVNTYPDVLNPFLYGPDEYDHFLAGILALLDASLGDTREEAVPYWMNMEVKSALDAVANKPEIEGEAHLKAGRERGKPNRLEIILDRTPQELAAAILGKVKG